jgi:hypothetical protein
MLIQDHRQLDLGARVFDVIDRVAVRSARSAHKTLMILATVVDT